MFIETSGNKYIHIEFIAKVIIKASMQPDNSINYQAYIICFDGTTHFWTKRNERECLVGFIKEIFEAQQKLISQV